MLMKFRFPLSVIALIGMIFVWRAILFKKFPDLVPAYTTRAEVTAISLTALKVKGKVTFEGKPFHEKSIITKPGMISTGKDSFVIVGFGDNFSSKIKISDNSVVDVSDIKVLKVSPNDKLEFLLHQGTVFFKIHNPSKSKILNVKTPTMSMGIRGTTFIVQASDEKSVLLVHEGRVEVVSNKGKPEMAEAGHGFEARLANELIPIEVTQYNPSWDMNSSESYKPFSAPIVRREKLDLPVFIEGLIKKAQGEVEVLQQQRPQKLKQIEDNLKAMDQESDLMSQDELCLQNGMRNCEFVSEHFKNDVANLKNSPARLSFNPSIKANLEKDFEKAKNEIAKRKDELKLENDEIDKNLQLQQDKLKQIIAKFELWKAADPISQKPLLKDLADLLNSSELQDAYLKSE